MKAAEQPEFLSNYYRIILIETSYDLNKIRMKPRSLITQRNPEGGKLKLLNMGIGSTVKDYLLTGGGVEDW